MLVLVAAAGMAAAGMAGAGASGGKKRCKKEGGALVTLQDLDNMHGQPPLEMNAKITVQAKPHNVALMGGAREVGGAAASTGGKVKRNDLIREIMKSKGMSLPEASKHIKENKLY